MRVDLPDFTGVLRSIHDVSYMVVETSGHTKLLVAAFSHVPDLVQTVCCREYLKMSNSLSVPLLLASSKIPRRLELNLPKMDSGWFRCRTYELVDYSGLAAKCRGVLLFECEERSIEK